MSAAADQQRQRERIRAAAAEVLDEAVAFTQELVRIPTVNPQHITPHAEAFQAVIWHLLVSHPALKATQTKWESTK